MAGKFIIYVDVDGPSDRRAVVTRLDWAPTSTFYADNSVPNSIPKFVSLTPPLPLHLAHFAARQIGRPSIANTAWLARLAQRFLGRSTEESYPSLAEVYRRARRVLKALGCPVVHLGETFQRGASCDNRMGGNISTTTEEEWLIEPSVADPNEVFEPVLLQAVRGRILLFHELQRVIRDSPDRFNPTLAQPDVLLGTLQRLRQSGHLTMLPAVARIDWHTWQCQRCGEQSRISCVDCAECGWPNCPWCDACASMGSCRGCRPLVACSVPDGELDAIKAAGAPKAVEAVNVAVGATLRPPKKLLHLDISLTPAQRDASLALTQFVDSSLQDAHLHLKDCSVRPNHFFGAGPTDSELRPQEALVWAACGAGKTEVAFEAIEQALSQGTRVLFTAPRRDVIAALEPRVKAAFPTVHVQVLYGGSEGRMSRDMADRPCLVVATAHQVMRLYRCFDLAGVDEVDAFPYRQSPMLQAGVRRALRPGAVWVLMTATPGTEFVRGVERGDLTCIRIPARHHGYPLPEPEPVLEPGMKERDWWAKGVPGSLAATLHAAASLTGPILLFVPTVRMVELLEPVLRHHLERNGILGEGLAATHSRDPHRPEKVASVLRGRVKWVLSTTILERGVTISGVHVIVLHADWERIFDVASLIQMAGRVGRTTDAPEGRVWFVAASQTDSIQGAIGAIRQMNEEAGMNGYLRPARLFTSGT